MTAKRTMDPIDSGNDPIVQLSDWLIEQAFEKADMAVMFQGCCERLRAAGVPLRRAYIGFRTLHPLFSSMSARWHPGEKVSLAAHPHGGGGRASKQWRESPFALLLRQGKTVLRRKLVGKHAELDFPILTELRDQGITDYLAFAADPVRVDRDEIVGSWATDRKGGFSRDHLDALERVRRWLTVACKISNQSQIARNALSTYLGPAAAGQVLEGKIRRGDGRTIYAAIWFSDLRNSTGLSTRLEEKEFLSLLNAYFECTAGAVMRNGGDVLLLIGDAVLAIFPIEQGRFTKADACAAALRAAQEAEANLAELNRERAGQELAFGIGLHVGSLMYGNIGVPERLEFTATGPAVNEAARLEELTKTLKRPILASAAFAERVKTPWEALGQHELRGLGCCHRIFTPPLAPPERQAAE